LYARQRIKLSLSIYNCGGHFRFLKFSFDKCSAGLGKR